MSLLDTRDARVEITKSPQKMMMSALPLFCSRTPSMSANHAAGMSELTVEESFFPLRCDFDFRQDDVNHSNVDDFKVEYAVHDLAVTPKT